MQYQADKNENNIIKKGIIIWSSTKFFELTPQELYGRW